MTKGAADDDTAPGGAAEAAHRPEDDGAELGVVGDEGDERDPGAGKGIERDPGENEGDDFGAAVLAGERVAEEGEGHAADEGEDGGGPAAEDGEAQPEGEHRAERRAVGDADQGGIGERIAEHALQGRARDRQGGADHDAEQDARQADRPDDRVLLLGVGGVEMDPDEAEQVIEDDGHDGARGHMDRAEHGAEDHRREQDEQHGRQEHGCGDARHRIWRLALPS